MTSTSQLLHIHSENAKERTPSHAYPHIQIYRVSALLTDK